MALKVTGARLSQVGILACEHDRTVPEVFPALLLGASMLSQAVTYLVAFTDVRELLSWRLRIVTE